MPPKRAAAAKPLFADCFFAVAGTFSSHTHQALNELLTGPNSGAQIASTVSANTTHLVTTEAEINKQSAKVTKAAARDTIILVSLDWILDSIKDKKRLDIKPYTFTNGASSSSPVAADIKDEDKDDDVNVQEHKTKPRAVKRKAAAAVAESDEEEDLVDKKIKTLKSKVAKSNGSVKIRQPAVDRACTLPAGYEVYVDDEVAWNARLNQTNIANNNNKFYLIQLLKRSNDMFAVFAHWGRVGVHGKSSTDLYSSVEAGKRGFDKKFKEKTKNNWEDRDCFVKHAGKYHLLPPDDADSDDEEDESAGEKKVKEEDKEEEQPQPESELDPKVQDLMGLIFNTNMMNRQMKELDYDASKMPLGKLAKATILHGYEVLKRISEVIDTPHTTARQNLLSELSSEFYTVIPHSFGFRVPPVIADAPFLKKKLEMLEALGEIEIAQKLMKESKKAPETLTVNPLDQHYASLKLNRLLPMDKSSERFKLIDQFVKNSHGKTHTGYDLVIDEVFDLERQGENERFADTGFDQMHNRRLLWHGSRLTNYVGILSQGLRIAPPEAPVTGYMFDKGAYFADCVSKSANYCFTDRHNNMGLMLLCEVALGDMFEIEQSDYNAKANSEGAGKHSTKGLGLSYPDAAHDVVIENGLRVQAGPLTTETNNSMKYRLQYNEYIVYNTSQVKMRYLLKMKFDYGKRGW